MSAEFRLELENTGENWRIFMQGMHGHRSTVKGLLLLQCGEGIREEQDWRGRETNCRR